MVDSDLTFFDKDSLLFRLNDALRRSTKDVVFVVGAPMTAPYNGEPGVADVAAVVELIRSDFAPGSRHAARFDTALAGSANCYQAAFDFLSGNAGQDAANRIIRQAVAGALRPSGTEEWSSAIVRLADDGLKALDQSIESWHLSPGAAALGELIAKFPDRFGKILVTSNFDPLMEVAVRRAGGAAWRTSLPTDGSLRQSEAYGCQVVHIHGYWYGSDTLHTQRQLLLNRPTLKNDLLSLLQDKIVVVTAYGGWPDIFTSALAGVVSNDNLFPEILWTFYGKNPSIDDHLLSALRPGIDRHRVTFYAGIDCHEVLPELLALWEESATSEPIDHDAEPTQLAALPATRRDRARLFRLAPLECDRPPSIEVWVGRENELRALETSKSPSRISCVTSYAADEQHG